MSTTTPQRTTVVCPVCWREITREQWERGCCLTPQEREVIR